MLGELTLRGDGEQLAGQGGERAVVAGGVVGEGGGELRGQERGVAGAGHEVLERGPELVGGGVIEGQAGANAAAQGEEVVLAEAFGEAAVAGQDDGEDDPGVAQLALFDFAPSGIPVG